MSRSGERMRLCAFLHASGHHVASWRLPDAPLVGANSLAHWVELARIAEQGLLDAIFLYDSAALPALPPDALSRTDRAVVLDPMVLLPALAMATERVGLIATGSTSYDRPYYLARRFLSLDHISAGRAGWNMVTGVNPDEAANLGGPGDNAMMPHGARYARAAEFATAVRGLWRSWDENAIAPDRATGRFFDPGGLHRLDHAGVHFGVRGPLGLPPSPQGHPVLVQAGGSEAGRALAAQSAEMVYSVQDDLADARAFYADVKNRMAAFGREPNQLLVMPGVYFIVGRSAQEAEDRFGALSGLTDPAVAMALLRVCLGNNDLSGVDPEGPVPDGLETNAGTTHLRQMVSIARARGLSVRRLACEVAAGGYGHWSVRGTASEIADQLQERFEAHAADGFNLMPATLPGGLRDFVELVVPELQRRGLFRTRYEGVTLRENLGLRRP